MAIKLKPEVPNELILENVLTLHHHDSGQSVRVVLLGGVYDDMLQIEVYKPTSPEYKDILLLFTKEQFESIIKLYNEWKELSEGATNDEC